MFTFAATQGSALQANLVALAFATAFCLGSTLGELLAILNNWWERRSEDLPQVTHSLCFVHSQAAGLRVSGLLTVD